MITGIRLDKKSIASHPLPTLKIRPTQEIFIFYLKKCFKMQFLEQELSPATALAPATLAAAY